MIVVGGAAAALLWMGYWMGRNSADKPLRSDNNPATIRPDTALDTGDVFNESMAADDDDERTPTMKGQ